MKKKVDLKMIKAAISELDGQGEPVTSRKVQAVTGGSMTTVLELMREAQQELAAGALVPQKNLPESVAEAIQGHVTAQVVAAIALVQAELAGTRAREDETLAALQMSEERVDVLQAELLQAIRENDKIRLASEKEAAGAEKEAEWLRKQLDDLKAEQRRLSEAGESAKTAVAIAELQLQRADQAAAKAEAQASELQEKYQALQEKYVALEKRLTAEKAAAEQRAGQAEQQALGLTSQLGWAERTMVTQVAEIKDACAKESEALRDRVRAADLAVTKAEERVARLEAELRVLNEKITGGEKMVV